MIVTLLTDFGLIDPYVGVMKGLILARAPEAQIVDLTHDVTPQAIDEAAFLLETSWRYFPPGTVHLAVVDPGVGTARERLAISVNGHFFAGPDNGILSGAIADGWRDRRGVGDGYRARPTTVPPEATARFIENESHFLRPVSATFEGRDVFAPVAAHLAQGGDLAELGPPASEMQVFQAFRAPSTSQRVPGVFEAAPGRISIDGLVLHVDRFGNLITDIAAADLPPEPTIAIAGHRPRSARTYGEADGIAAIAGSSGRIEIAVPNGSAAITLGAGRGDRVTVT